VAIQIETAKRRLAAAARAQADLATQGWEIARTETKISVDMGGIAVVGQIDRIDRHGDTGAVRLLDYKSSDTAADPREAHVGPPAPAAPAYAQLVSEGKPARWIDLQLPLYRILIAASGEFSGPCEVGYFNLPKAASETGVALWEGFSEEIVSSARACAEGVIRDVLARRFWPPAEKVPYDDFETLFPGPVADYVEVEKFLAEWK
jgi:ATP-dependent helicase/nuclease subunit B